MENKDFDFSKNEDQVKFDQLSQEEKDRLVNEAHVEALVENQNRINIPENDIESVYDLEGMGQFRRVSDQVVHYLANHNVFESKNIRDGFEKLIKSPDKTYVTQVHPLFKTVASEDLRDMYPLSLIHI